MHKVPGHFGGRITRCRLLSLQFLTATWAANSGTSISVEKKAPTLDEKDVFSEVWMRYEELRLTTPSSRKETEVIDPVEIPEDEDDLTK